MSTGMLNIRQRLVDPDTGICDKDWFRFFSSLQSFTTTTNAGAPEFPVDASGSNPFTYTPGQLGTLLVADGGIEEVQYTRDNVTYYNLGAFRGLFPMGPADSMVFTYIAGEPPTLVFFPANASP